MERVENKIVKIGRDEVLVYFKELNISREKLTLYSNFIKVFYKNVYDTYLGKEVIKTEEDVRGHMKWCLNQTISFFNEMNIYFRYDEKLIDIFYNFFLGENVYRKSSNDINYENDIRMIDIIFNFDSDKTSSMIKFISVHYQILNNCFNITA